MSKLYVPEEIPLNYKFVRVGSNYIDYFDRATAQNVTLTYYRQYYDISPDFVVQRQETFGSYYTSYFDEVETNHHLLSRNDCGAVFTVCFIICFFFVMLFNIMTSLVKKGGVLGGLF